MLFVDEFEVGQLKESVFSKLAVLQVNYPNLSLSYREGRRFNDKFHVNVWAIKTVRFETVEHSNEWKVYLNGDHEGTEFVHFRFNGSKLNGFSPQECLLELPPKMTKEQVAMLKACDMFIKEIQRKIVKPLEQDAWQKMGPAFKTTFCVVGKDMNRGIKIVGQALESIDKSKVSSAEDFLKQLTKQIDRLIYQCDYADSEGFIVGTTTEAILRARKLKSCFNRFRKSRRAIK